MKVGSLFSGIGGIEIGFEKQGFKTEWFVEREQYAKEILKKRFHGTKIYDDVTEIDFTTVPKVDILTGGFPCQDISNAGKRIGIEGSRSSLWKYFLKAISEIRPKFTLIENVSALVGRGLDVVLCDLAKIGYDAEWYCISASTVGAPHKRERVFILAYPDSNWKSDESINEGKGQGFVDELSNSNNEGWKRRGETKMGCEELPSNALENTECNGIDSGCGQENNPRKEGFKHTNITECSGEGDRGWWATEPELGRVANGIPNRVDRIKCLGNAVVPQVAEVFAKAIREKLETFK